MGGVRETRRRMVEGNKYDAGKLPWDLLPPRALELVVEVLQFGAKKYGPYNWRKGIRYSRLFAAVQRHLWAFWQGENLDPETKISHLAHAACGILFMLQMRADFAKLGEPREFDDRWSLASLEAEDDE